MVLICSGLKSFVLLLALRRFVHSEAMRYPFTFSLLCMYWKLDLEFLCSLELYTWVLILTLEFQSMFYVIRPLCPVIYSWNANALIVLVQYGNCWIVDVLSEVSRHIHNMIFFYFSLSLPNCVIAFAIWCFIQRCECHT